MPTIIHMPAVAAGATEVVLSAWTLEDGAAFATHDVYAVIETDKATVDLESETDGVLVRRLVPAGAEVEIGAPIALVAGAEEEISDVDATLADLGVRAVSACDATFPERRDVPDEARPETNGPVTHGSGSAAEKPTSATAVPTPATAGTSARVFASPLARRMARDGGLDVGELAGTGPGGRIVRRDVERALQAGRDHREHVVVPRVDRESAMEAATESGTTAVPHSRLRRALARRLTQSKQQTPHFYVRGTAQVDRLLDLRHELKAAGITVSVNDLVVRAVARAHRAHPELNVVWTDDAVVEHSRVDVAVAVATDRGLLTPVLRDVANRPLTDLAADARDLVARAHDGKLSQNELEGGTVAVSNLGMLGTEEFSAIINPPHASIVAVGAVRDEVVAVDGTPAVRPVVKVVLSVDHRPVDGASAARWMSTFLQLLEHPVGLLA